MEWSPGCFHDRALFPPHRDGNGDASGSLRFWLDVAADSRLVAGEIAELVGEDLKPGLVRDDNACDHGDHIPFVGGDSSRTARDSSPRQNRQVVGATRALVAKLWKPPADQGLVFRSATRCLVLGGVAARGSRLLGGLLCEDRLDGVALGLGLALDIRPDRLGALEYLWIGLAAFDPVL